MDATAIEKVSIIISKGSLEGVYPGLIMANGARAEGIEANLFFTFFGLDAIHKARHDHIKMATVGNPGLHLATWPADCPACPRSMTHYMNHKMEKLDIPSDPRVRRDDRRHRRGPVRVQGVRRPVRPHKDDLIDQVKDIITVGEFYDHGRRRPDHLHLRFWTPDFVQPAHDS